MIKRIGNYLSALPPVWIDGMLYVMVAWLIFAQAYLGGDEAAKYIAPMLKFWINFGIGSMAAATGALKMYRSSSYADHRKQKDLETSMWLRQNQTALPPEKTP